MTREEIVEQIEALHRQLDELDKAQGLAFVNTPMTEAEKEKQHQVDLSGSEACA